MMRSGFSKLLGTALLVCIGMSAYAQKSTPGGPGWSGCIDNANTAPFSTDYGVNFIGDSLMGATVGASGTVTFGGVGLPRPTTDPPATTCFEADNPDGVTVNVRGRIGFQIGSVGSVQSTFDDGMPLTFGMPIAPGGSWSYATLVTDGTQSLFGANAFVTAFTGSSDRYTYAETVNGTTDISLRLDILGDAARLQWTLTNQDTAASHNLSIWFGQWVAMLASNGDSSGYNDAENPDSQPGNQKDGYVVVPFGRPPVTEQRYQRALTPTTYPTFVDFCFGQTEAYGMRVINGPTVDTEDTNGLNSDATPTMEFALGQSFFLLGGVYGGDEAAFPDKEFGPNNTGGDVPYLDRPGYIQKYTPVAVPSGASTQIISYYKSTWSASNYFRPYSVVLDAPNLIATDLTTNTGLAQPAGGSTIRVYIDNTRGFSTIDQSIELDNVNVTLTLPTGLSLAAGDTATKTISRILPAAANLSFVDYHVIADGVTFGNLTYSVTVSPTPGPTKTVSGVIQVAGTPKLVLSQGANLVTTPFNFTDTSWEKILGLSVPTDFQAFDWDPLQNGYIISTSASRGKGSWIVATNQVGVLPLQSNPTVPTDIAAGTRSIQLSGGWNLIGNPYNYAVPLGQLIGVSAAAPTQSYMWSDLVAQGFVNGALAQYNATTQTYTYIQDLNALLQPNTGYWLFVNTAQDLTLAYPPVFTEFLPNSTRSAAQIWTQTDNMWRLQLAARTAKSLDSNNYIGVVSSKTLQTSYQIVKPPMLPLKNKGVSLSINQAVGTKTLQMAQALSVNSTQQAYTVSVTSNEDGDVTLTWPNMSTLPKTLAFRLVDTATNQTRNLSGTAGTSGYTFTAKAGTTRVFTLQVTSASASKAVIGSVLATRATRSPNSPVSIVYSLSGDATTSIQILGPTGKEIYTVISGRGDKAGPNTATWNLKDNANRSVAPGTYTVVVVADAADGTRVRKVTTVTLTR